MNFFKFNFWVVFLSLLVVSCKPAGKTENSVGIEAQPDAISAYAKYKTAVQKDVKLKEWMAALNKAESVKILSEIKESDKNGKEIIIAMVELSDGRRGYLPRSALGGKPFVVLENIRVFDKPDYASKVRATLKQGDIVFWEEENDAGNWLKVWAGKIDGVWITSHWIEKNSKLSESPNMVVDARDYQEALALINENKFEAAVEKLKALAEYGSSDFAQMGKQKWEELILAQEAKNNSLNSSEAESVNKTPSENR